MSYLHDRFDEDDAREARKKIGLAFKTLRKLNIRAKANFMCCTGCATAAMSLKGYAGGVYWHHQAEQGFKESGQLYIGFFTDKGDGSVVIGAALAAALKEQGLDVEWDGTGETKVAIYAKGARKNKDKE